MFAAHLLLLKRSPGTSTALYLNIVISASVTYGESVAYEVNAIQARIQDFCQGRAPRE